MLDNDDRVALIDQFIQYIHQDADILKVQSGSRFVKNIKRLARIPLGEFGGQLHTLALATGERGGRLPQLDIPQTDLLNYLNLVQYLRYVFKEFHSTVYRHIQYVGNGLTLEAHFQRFAIVTLAMANLTRDIYIGQEVHLNGFVTVALAGFTTSAAYIERETSRLVSADFGFGQADKQVADIGKTPVYVAGLERGVRPSGDWSTFTTLSIYSSPSILPYSKGS